MFSTRCHSLAMVRKLTDCYASVNICSTATQLSKTFDYYEALGIPHNSTQSDIKAAYYELSKQFHPDKNQGSESAAQKFREITQAYEVLGNYKLRRLYDKGIHTGGTPYAQQQTGKVHDEIYEDDDLETKFYKSRFRKSKIVDMKGRTPIYDFDEWSKAHYGKSFQRRQDAKNKYERQKAKTQSEKMSLQNETLIFAMLIIAVLVYALFLTESAYDTPRTRTTEKDQNNPKT